MHHDRGVLVWALMTITQYDMHVIAIGWESFLQYSSAVFRQNPGENESEASPSNHKNLYDPFDGSRLICLAFSLDCALVRTVY